MDTALVLSGELDEQIDAALKKLTAKQRKFAMVYAGGDNQMSAAIKAGYAPGTARFQASRLLTNANFAHVQHAVALLRQKYAWEHGIPAKWKREQLVALFGQARDLEQCSAANQTMRTLAEIDGDIRATGSAPTNIQLNIVTGISRDD